MDKNTGWGHIKSNLTSNMSSINLKKISNNKNTFKNNIINQINTLESKKIEYEILIVDFDEPTLIILKSFFELNGYSSCCLRNGIECLKQLKKSIPKLILLDVMIPDISAFKLCKKIKSITHLKSIPIFYLTSIPKDIVKEKLEITNVDGLISKPFSLETLKFLLKFIE